jgi:hypothetical protein
LGKVFKPEDLAGRRKIEVPDISPTPLPRPARRPDLQSLAEEVRLLKAEVAKIKEVLRSHGIPVD